MPLSMEEQAELAELEELEELSNLEAESAKQSQALQAIKGPVQSAARTAGKALNYVDAFTGAPIRAAAGAFADMDPARSPAKAFIEQFGEDPSKAPTGKELAARAGLSTDESLDTTLMLDPFTRKTLKVSPAGLGGAAIETVSDPTTYIGGAAAKQGMKAGITGAKRLAPEVRSYLENIARERAVKASTGESVKAIRKAAKLSGEGGNVAAAQQNLRRAGEILLEGEDPAVRAFSTTSDIGQRAEAKRQQFGKKIGQVGETVDAITPNSISGEQLGLDALEFSDTIPNVGEGAPVRGRVAEEAERLAALGNMSFGDAQRVKGQYPYKPQSPDLLISNRDKSNKFNRIVSDRMDESVDTAAKQATPEQKAVLGEYGPAKERYGVFKNAADAASDQEAKALSRRIVSPSDYATGAATMVADAASGGSMSLIKGMAMGAANKIIRGRGNSTMAAGLNQLAKAAAATPQKLKKYENVLKGSALKGTQSLVATHHLLMNNDEEYRNIIEQTEGEP